MVWEEPPSGVGPEDPIDVVLGAVAGALWQRAKPVASSASTMIWGSRVAVADPFEGAVPVVVTDTDRGIDVGAPLLWPVHAAASRAMPVKAAVRLRYRRMTTTFSGLVGRIVNRTALGSDSSS
jgi:hypothetical protein